jgi:hypothetical protein
MTALRRFFDEKDLLQTHVVFFYTAGYEFKRRDADVDEGSRCNENEVNNWVDKLVWLFQDLLLTMLYYKSSCSTCHSCVM